MRSDYLAFKRATNASLLGIVFQLVLGVILLVYGSQAGDHAAMTISGFVLTGLLAWTTLALVFDQHRRERIESIEAENFASEDLATSSVFEEGAGDLRVQAKRLAVMHRLLVPTVSVLIGGLLAGLGIWRFISARAVMKDDLAWMGSDGPGIAIGLGGAAVGFIFARFISGMAKVESWQNLRGGAAFAVGSSLFSVALVVAKLANLAGTDIVLQIITIGIPAAMIVLGAEVFLNFVLEVYRPRKAGEVARPAFDSRLLGLVAAPDRIAESISDAINYQFGFDVSSSWFYRLLSRWFVGLIELGLAVLWGLTALQVVEPHQRGLVLRLGAPQQEAGPGLLIKAPWPIDTVMIPEYIREDADGKRTIEYTSTGVRRLDLGADMIRDGRTVLWASSSAARDRNYFLVQPSAIAGAGVDDDGPSFGEGFSLAAVEIPVYYSVKPGELQNYITLGPDAEMRHEILRAAGQRAVLGYLGGLRIDSLIGGRRQEVADELTRVVSDAFDALNPDPETGEPMGAGVEVLSVSVAGARPPQNVAKAFEHIVEANQKRAARIAAAEKEAIEKLAEVIGGEAQAREVVKALEAHDALERRGADQGEILASEVALRELIERSGGKAAQVIATARSDRWDRHMGERTRSVRYDGQIDAFRAAPDIFRARAYFDTLVESLADARVIVTGPEVENLHIRFDAQDTNLSDGIFGPEVEGE